MKRIVQYKGVTLDVILDSFDIKKPMILIRGCGSAAQHTFFINVANFHPDWTRKEAIVPKMRILAYPYGELIAIGKQLDHEHEFTGREIVFRDVTFVETIIQTDSELMSVYVPKSDVVVASPNLTQAVTGTDWKVLEDKPMLVGTMLGRTFLHVETDKGFRFIYGPKAA